MSDNISSGSEIKAEEVIAEGSTFHDALILNMAPSHDLAAIKKYVEAGEKVCTNRAFISILKCPVKTEENKMAVDVPLGENAVAAAYQKFGKDMVEQAGNVIEIVKCFLENGADVNYNGGEPLKTAIMMGNLAVVDFLVKNGAKVNICEGSVNTWTKKGTKEFKVATPLEIATTKRFCVRCRNDIRSAGSKKDVAYFKNMSRNNCAVCGLNFDIVEYLLNNGASLSYNNRSALLGSIKSGYVEMVKYLVSREGIDHPETWDDFLNNFSITIFETIDQCKQFAIDAVHKRNVVNAYIARPAVQCEKYETVEDVVIPFNQIEDFFIKECGFIRKEIVKVEGETEAQEPVKVQED